MHALIEVGLLLERLDLGERTDYGADPVPDLSHKGNPQVAWVPITPRGAAPVHDPETHKPPEQGPDTITATSLTETWDAAVALTAQEITDRDSAIQVNVTTEVDAANFEGGFESVRARALIELLNKRDNYLANRIIELQNRVQAMLDSTGPADNMRSAGLGVSISATGTRTKAEAIQDYKDDIGAGNQDKP